MNEKMPVEEIEPTPENITIYEVARRAGVSIATVSHALNRPERVAATTRRRVLDTAQELGFVPRGRGKALPTLRRVAAVGPFGAHPSYVSRLLGVVNAEPRADVVVIDSSSDANDPILDQIGARGPLDGVIIMGAEPTPRLATQLNEAGVPVVLLDRSSQSFVSVRVDDEAGGALLADHLLSIGARRIAWVSPVPPPSGYVTSGELRLSGFVSALRSHGHSGEVEWTICEDTFDGGRVAAAEMVGEGPLPDAVFAVHDVIAAGVVAGFREHHLRVPEDVSVVGYDDADAATLFDLTTIRQPFRESGRIALESLRTLCASPEHPVAHTILMPELIVRASTIRSKENPK